MGLVLTILRESGCATESFAMEAFSEEKKSKRAVLKKSFSRAEGRRMDVWAQLDTRTGTPPSGGSAVENPKAAA
jgi:hypothetical protein